MALKGAIYHRPEYKPSTPCQSQTGGTNHGSNGLRDEYDNPEDLYEDIPNLRSNGGRCRMMPITEEVHLDVQNRTLSINKSVARQDGKLVISTPKTPNSIRTVLLPEETVKLLVEEHERHPVNPYLFPSPRTGETWDPDGFRRLHDRIIREIGAEHVRFHDMRHTFATLSLKSGVDVRTLSETLGHFSAGFTLSTYVHSTSGMKQSAADAIGNTIRNAI